MSRLVVPWKLGVGGTELVARRKVLAGAGLALVLTLTGCYFPYGVEVSASEVEGIWVAVGPQGQEAKLVFLADGTYSGTGVPNGLAHEDPEIPPSGSPDWNSTSPITGSWKTDWKERGEQMYVVIEIKGTITRSTPLHVEERQKGRRLVWYIGDPDSDREVSFRKEAGLDITAQAHPS